MDKKRRKKIMKGRQNKWAKREKQNMKNKQTSLREK